MVIQSDLINSVFFSGALSKIYNGILSLDKWTLIFYHILSHNLEQDQLCRSYWHNEKQIHCNLCSLRRTHNSWFLVVKYFWHMFQTTNQLKTVEWKIWIIPIVPPTKLCLHELENLTPPPPSTNKSDSIIFI